MALSERRAVRAGGSHVPNAVQPVHEADVVEAGTPALDLVMPMNPGKGVGGSRLSLEQLLEEAGYASSPEGAKTAVTWRRGRRAVQMYVLDATRSG